MKTLHPNWFFEDLNDFEYKKYLLLAYLQDVHKQFNETKLYPGLADLVMHYRNLTEFLSLKSEFYHSVPNQVKQIDLYNFKIAFGKALENDELMEYIEALLDFSIPAIRKHLDEGKEIYEFIEKEIQLTPIGILPVYKDEGYMLVRNETGPIEVYEYRMRFFSHEDDQYRSINTEYITTYSYSMFNTWENIKIDLIRKRKKLPNPAAFAIESAYSYPLHETIMPIAKRMVVKYVS